MFTSVFEEIVLGFNQKVSLLVIFLRKWSRRLFTLKGKIYVAKTCNFSWVNEFLGKFVYFSSS